MKNLFLIMMALTTLSAHALTVDSINFEDKVNVAGKDLVINGVGIRKATFLKIKVYYGALYISQKTSNSGTFLGTTEPKQIIMHFVRDVEVKDLKKTYLEAFEGANKDSYKALLPTLEAFNANLGDIKKGERMVINFLPDGAVLTFASKTFPKVGDAKFSQALLNMWFVNPLDQGLMSGLLGQQ
ncbi:MAG: chalcone isomerase family protein [Bdellovibrionales bacterium]|nr:chalcone isomerase family protein [Bdellovibrionales bacterium]